jgi:hypothetical protein
MTGNLIFAATTRSVVACNSAVLDLSIGFDGMYVRRRIVLKGIDVPDVLMDACKHALIVLIGGQKSVAVNLDSTSGEVLFGEIYLRERLRGDPMIPLVDIGNDFGMGLPISPIIRGIISGDLNMVDIRQTLNG